MVSCGRTYFWAHTELPEGSQPGGTLHTNTFLSATVLFCLVCRLCFKLVFVAHWLTVYSFWFWRLLKTKWPQRSLARESVTHRHPLMFSAGDKETSPCPKVHSEGGNPQVMITPCGHASLWWAKYFPRCSLSRQELHRPGLPSPSTACQWCGLGHVTQPLQGSVCVLTYKTSRMWLL